MNDKISLEEFKEVCKILENAIRNSDSLDARILRILDRGMK